MTDSNALKPVLERLVSSAALSEAEAETVFEQVIAGAASDAQIGAVLTALAMRGETVSELTGCVRSLRRHAITIVGPRDAIDCCGTGGDGKGTLNVSTAVAFVVAACGVPVAKHGNRAASSRSGAADVLGALGIESRPSPADAERSLERHGLAFLFAPNHHPAMRAVAALRQELGFRSIFNLAAPLANPAGIRRQLMGVYDSRWLEPVAEVLRRLGSVAAWVVHGADGLDELTVTGPSEVAILAGNEIARRTVTPADAGLGTWPIAAIQGGEPAMNAAAVRRLLAGEAGAYRDIVLLNAAAALIVAGRAETLCQGAEMAAAAIDDGRARAKLDQMIAEQRGQVA